ncbi:MAG: AI-2E family transporter [Candidatus Falkowbacteria bacterium]
MPKNNQSYSISIDTKTIIKTLAILGGTYLLFSLWSIVLIILTAFVFSLALNPLVDSLTTKKLPRSISLVAIYLVITTILIFLVSFTIQPLVLEATEFANNLPLLARGIQPFIFKLSSFSQSYPWLNINSVVNGASQAMQGSINNLLGGITNFLSGILTLLLIMILTFYMVSEEKSVKKSIASLAPAKQREHVLEISNQVQRKMGHWLIGQTFLCFIIFLFTYVSLSILGVKYALLLSIIAGIAEAVPYIGPIISVFPATLVALTQSPLLALFVVIIFFLIQQIENSVLVPTVMRQAVGLDPIISILVLLVGYQLGGILGALLAIPLATVGVVIIKSWPKRHKKASKRLLRA